MCRQPKKSNFTNIAMKSAAAIRVRKAGPAKVDPTTLKALLTSGEVGEALHVGYGDKSTSVPFLVFGTWEECQAHVQCMTAPCCVGTL